MAITVFGCKLWLLLLLFFALSRHPAEASEALNPLLLIKTVGLHDWLRLSCKGSRKSGFLNARVVFGI